jgi:hypothetical protein
MKREYGIALLYIATMVVTALLSYPWGIENGTS